MIKLTTKDTIYVFIKNSGWNHMVIQIYQTLDNSFNLLVVKMMPDFFLVCSLIALGRHLNNECGTFAEQKAFSEGDEECKWLESIHV